MKFRFTIGKKIGTGFGVLLLLTLIVFALTYVTLSGSRKINDEITRIYNPSVDVLEDLNLLMVRSKMLISNWVFIQSSEDNIDKQHLRKLINQDYPQKKDEIMQLAMYWNKDDRDKINDIFRKIESLFILHQDIMDALNSFQSYEDPMMHFMVRPMVEGGDVDIRTNAILSNLSEVIVTQHENTNIVSNKMLRSFDSLEFVVKTLGLALLIGGVMIAMFTVRTIVNPVQQLRNLLLLLGDGIIPKKRMKDRSDEIGEMSTALNDLVDGFKRTSEFAKEVGSGNFQSDYKPLSKDDSLGYSLLTMRKDLYELTSNLELKVKERTEEVVKQKEEIEHKNKEITASIRYAKRIQEAILPDKKTIGKILKDYFILYKPKDIVSGDFYWVEEKNNKALFAAVDCTGHGVPGAFMSIIGNDLLKQAVKEHGKMKPSDILNEVNRLAAETIKQTFEESTVKDGMDISFCSIDFENLELEFAGAYNPVYIYRKNKDHPSDNGTGSENKEREVNDAVYSQAKVAQKAIDERVIVHHFENCSLIEIRADKFPIGVFFEEEDVELFTNHKFKLKKGDVVYSFSDGFADQFGGTKGKKFMSRQFKQMFAEIIDMPMEKQKNHIDKSFENWRGKQEQVDDICVIGVRI